MPSQSEAIKNDMMLKKIANICMIILYLPSNLIIQTLFVWLTSLMYWCRLSAQDQGGIAAISPDAKILTVGNFLGIPTNEWLSGLKYNMLEE